MNKKFKKVLIVNRGEIAVRIIRALRDLEIQSVGLYSDADAYSMHRKLADLAIRLPGLTSAETYLNVPAIIAAVKQSGADAVHPGYGFLAENHEFAKQIEDLGVTFIGPTSKSMQQMGDKISARNIMTKAGVPVVPGSNGPLKDWEELKMLAGEIGYPLILKAAAGGGGRGMRVVRHDNELQAAFEACTREAQAYFANPEIFCERYVENGRHIEVQVLFDKHGHGVHLFERDCSIQRRHQKLLEEAPSTFLNEKLRHALGDIAVKAGTACNYHGVGTVEFICESPERCYFMEMNTRIQVEHPVTELITGIDLISEQIKAAWGEKLSFGQEDIQLRGWSFETRINAEIPEQGFLPMPGIVHKLKLPSGPFVRVDTHLYPGYEIPSQYDSMIAKVITWGATRDEALQRMRRALSEIEIEGVPTTARFHEAVFDDDDFCKGNFNTGYIELKQEALLKSMESTAKTCSDLEALFSVVLTMDHNSRQLTPNKDMRQLWTERGRFEIERRF